MGLYDCMTASVSGMTAHSNALTNTAQNIANVSTVGYKKITTQFSTLIDQPNGASAAAGGVTATSVNGVLTQGVLQSTQSSTDLAINGGGFFTVSDGDGNFYLTRSGSFTLDASGNLVNSAGHFLMGYSAAGGSPPQQADSFAGLQKVQVGAGSQVAVATNGALTIQNGNSAPAAAYVIPLANVPGPDYLAAGGGNVFSLTPESGAVAIAPAGTAGLGVIQSGQLEQSTADPATELSAMIVAQKGFQSNFQALKTSSDSLETLVKLKIE